MSLLSFRRSRVGFCWILTAWLCGKALVAFSDFQNSDPAQWTSDDVYRILHDSAWTKTTKLSSSGSRGSDSIGDSGNTANAPVTTPGNAGQMPGRMGGGLGRRGMGGSGGTYSSSGRRSGSTSSKSQPTEVTVQWQSALPVRVAAAKNEGQPPAVAPGGNEYVVAVIGLPLADFGGRAASADSDSTTNENVTRRVEDELKRSTSLVRSHHEPLLPTKVELDQGKDGRTLFYFPKDDPITIKDKTVEFRIANGQAAVHKTFTLKEMIYQGRLQL